MDILNNFPPKLKRKEKQIHQYSKNWNMINRLYILFNMGGDTSYSLATKEEHNFKNIPIHV